jgi:hypothetical protein
VEPGATDATVGPRPCTPDGTHDQSLDRPPRGHPCHTHERSRPGPGGWAVSALWSRRMVPDGQGHGRNLGVTAGCPASSLREGACSVSGVPMRLPHVGTLAGAGRQPRVPQLDGRGRDQRGDGRDPMARHDGQSEQRLRHTVAANAVDQLGQSGLSSSTPWWHAHRAAVRRGRRVVIRAVLAVAVLVSAGVIANGLASRRASPSTGQASMPWMCAGSSAHAEPAAGGPGAERVVARTRIGKTVTCR